VKYAFICGEEGNYPVAKMCRWSKVSRSGYYEWRGRVPSSTAVRRQRLEVLVAWSFTGEASVKMRPDVGQSMPSTMRNSRSTPSERATSASW
jgi:hypothetical protein